MIEKVNPSHPDKIADRLAGALVDYAYSVQPNPRIAVEVLIGHGVATSLRKRLYIFLLISFRLLLPVSQAASSLTIAKRSKTRIWQPARRAASDVATKASSKECR